MGKSQSGVKTGIGVPFIHPQSLRATCGRASLQISIGGMGGLRISFLSPAQIRRVVGHVGEGRTKRVHCAKLLRPALVWRDRQRLVTSHTIFSCKDPTAHSQRFYTASLLFLFHFTFYESHCTARAWTNCYLKRCAIPPPGSKFSLNLSLRNLPSREVESRRRLKRPSAWLRVAAAA